MRDPRRTRRKTGAVIAAVLVILIVCIAVLVCLRLLPGRTYSAKHFGIETVISGNDRDGDGIDDYTDILLGARQDAENHPRYVSAYYEGGYPPDDEGVCTDLVWRAFLSAGYNLKDMLDRDIAENTGEYPRVEGSPDPNIDFRRVPNLKVFFDRYAVSYSLDPGQIDQWQPGDIVIFGESFNHIGIISDKRNKEGIAYLIHNSGQADREQDVLLEGSRTQTISGHYRFESIPSRLID